MDVYIEFEKIFKDVDIEKTLSKLKIIGELLECSYPTTEEEFKDQIMFNLKELKNDPKAESVGGGLIMVERMDGFTLKIEAIIATSSFTAHQFNKDD